MSGYNNLEFFCGRKRSGKDFCVAGLIEDVGGIRLSFSDELRYVAHDIYPWCPVFPSDAEKDVPINHPDNVRGLTPRQIWLHLGSPEGLRYVQPDLFLAAFIRNQLPRVIANPQQKFFVTDVRTPEEYAWVKSIKGVLTRISRPDREGIVEDKIEEFIDQMEVDFEYVHKFEGSEPFIYFYRNRHEITIE